MNGSRPGGHHDHPTANDRRGIRRFCVFLIGLRVSALWKPHRWMPVAFATPWMIRAWADFNRRAARGDVGIWHETYRVSPGRYECIDNNMPAFGPEQATRLVAATGRRETAEGRMVPP